MNIKTLILAVTVLGATGSALAQEYIAPDPFVGTKSRAEVVAELDQARKDGSLDVLDHAYPSATQVAGTRTRDEVKAELADAKARGTLEVLDSVYPIIESAAQSKTRDEVRAELAEFQRTHPNQRSGNI